MGILKILKFEGQLWNWNSRLLSQNLILFAFDTIEIIFVKRMLLKWRCIITPWSSWTMFFETCNYEEPWNQLFEKFNVTNICTHYYSGIKGLKFGASLNDTLTFIMIHFFLMLLFIGLVATVPKSEYSDREIEMKMCGKERNFSDYWSKNVYTDYWSKNFS